MIAWLAIAFAHHDTAVARVGDGPALTASLADEVDPDRPELVVGLSVGGSRFSGARRGGAKHALDAGSVTVGLAELAVGARLPGGTSLGLALPVGVVDVRTPIDRHAAPGVGDLRVELAQTARSERSALRLRIGALAPTGGTDDRAAVSLLDLGAGYRVVSYDTRASLGAGSWSALAGIDAWRRVGPASVGLEADVRAPFTDTPDAIRWGADLAARLGGDLPIARRLAAGARVGLRRHTSDALAVLSEDTGEPVEIRSGGRSALTAHGRIGWRPRDDLQLSASVGAPVWQHVQGVQLAEAVSGGLALSVRR